MGSINSKNSFLFQLHHLFILSIKMEKCVNQLLVIQYLKLLSRNNSYLTLFIPQFVSALCGFWILKGRFGSTNTSSSSIRAFNKSSSNWNTSTGNSNWIRSIGRWWNGQTRGNPKKSCWDKRKNWTSPKRKSQESSWWTKGKRETKTRNGSKSCWNVSCHWIQVSIWDSQSQLRQMKNTFPDRGEVFPQFWI